MEVRGPGSAWSVSGQDLLHTEDYSVRCSPDVEKIRERRKADLLGCINTLLSFSRVETS